MIESVEEYFTDPFDFLWEKIEYINTQNDKEENIMVITKTKEGTSLTLAIEGRLDTTTAPQLESEIKSSLDGIDKLLLDFTSLEYISSAGLRVLLSAQKTMNKQGSMVIRNVNEDVMDIFNITGFVDILTIE